MGGETKSREEIVLSIRQKYDRMQWHLDERGRRVWAAIEAKALGHGGITLVSEATGLARSTIQQGKIDLLHPEEGHPPDRKRMFGGGRKKNQ